MPNPSDSDGDDDDFVSRDEDPALAGFDSEYVKESYEVTPNTAAIAKDLAEFWLTSMQLVHAAATVAVIREVPGVRPNLGTEYFLEATAWLHQVLTVGATEWGAPVLPEYLRAGGLPPHVVVALRVLHRERWMTDHWYSRVLDGAPDLIKIVACASRIATLRAERPSATKYEWRALTYDTKHWLGPITFDMPPPWGTWLRAQLEELSAGARDGHE